MKALPNEMADHVIAMTCSVLKEQYPKLSPEELLRALDDFYSLEGKDGPEQLLTVKEVASILKLSTRSIHNLLNSSKLVKIKCERATRIPASSVESYIHRNQMGVE